MQTQKYFFTVAFLTFEEFSNSLKAPFYDTQTWQDRSGIVHLFEWKWLDIARECEQFLAPKGYAGVQISPSTENVIIRRENGDRPWWERYQVISYRLITRSGNEKQLKEMTHRCNAVGVRIYVDLVINHMTGDAENAIGTGGSTANPAALDYPAVPYNSSHFNSQCGISNYQNAEEVRSCNLVGLHDLNHTSPYVREKIIELMNHLIDLGVTGFRIDAAKHMYPEHLLMIAEGMKPLSTKYGFPPDSKPLVFQEVIDLGGEGISYQDYTHIGRIIDFRYSSSISQVFRGDDQLRWLKNWGQGWNLVYGPISIVFVDNHDNQRENNGNGPTLNYKRLKQYKMAVAFMMAHPHGFPRIMSSFTFETSDQGPPMTREGDLISPAFGRDGSCSNGYICEHRWRQIYNMVAFRNTAGTTPLENWWDNGGNQIAFSRGNKAFVAFNNEGHILDETLSTGLPAGTYCDIINGNVSPSGDGCTGKSILVNNEGKAHIVLRPDEEDGVVAIHVAALAKKTT